MIAHVKGEPERYFTPEGHLAELELGCPCSCTPPRLSVWDHDTCVLTVDFPSDADAQSDFYQRVRAWSAGQ
jgi:hypothetical protein